MNDEPQTYDEAVERVHRAFCDPSHELVGPWDQEMAAALKRNGYAIVRAEARPPEGLDADRLARALHEDNERGEWCACVGAYDKRRHAEWVAARLSEAECAICGAMVPVAIWTRHLENGCQPEDTAPLLSAPPSPAEPPRPDPMDGWTLDFDAHERWLVLTDPEGASAVVASGVSLEYGGDIARRWRAEARPPEGLDRLIAAAKAVAADYPPSPQRGGTPRSNHIGALQIAAARLSTGGATKPQGGER